MNGIVGKGDALALLSLLGHLSHRILQLVRIEHAATKTKRILCHTRILLCFCQSCGPNVDRLDRRAIGNAESVDLLQRLRR